MYAEERRGFVEIYDADSTNPSDDLLDQYSLHSDGYSVDLEYTTSRRSPNLPPVCNTGDTATLKITGPEERLQWTDKDSVTVVYHDETQGTAYQHTGSPQVAEYTWAPENPDDVEHEVYVESGAWSIRQCDRDHDRSSPTENQSVEFDNGSTLVVGDAETTVNSHRDGFRSLSDEELEMLKEQNDRDRDYEYSFDVSSVAIGDNESGRDRLDDDAVAVWSDLASLYPWTMRSLAESDETTEDFVDSDSVLFPEEMMEDLREFDDFEAEDIDVDAEEIIEELEGDYEEQDEEESGTTIGSNTSPGVSITLTPDPDSSPATTRDLATDDTDNSEVDDDVPRCPECNRRDWTKPESAYIQVECASCDFQPVGGLAETIVNSL